LIFDNPGFTQSISEREANDLKSFLRGKMGKLLPPDAKIEVTGFETSPLKGFKKGRFSVQTSKGSGPVPVPFLISQDGKYIIIGEPVDTTTFKTSPLGIKEGKIQIAGTPIPIIMSSDGRYFILGGELIEFKANPPE
jgi:hypothetical protein